MRATSLALREVMEARARVTAVRRESAFWMISAVRATEASRAERVRSMSEASCSGVRLVGSEEGGRGASGSCALVCEVAGSSAVRAAIS